MRTHYKPYQARPTTEAKLVYGVLTVTSILTVLTFIIG